MKRNKLSRTLFCIAFAMLLISCSSDDGNGGGDDDTTQLPPFEIPSLAETTIWTGPTITFQKSGGADPALAENQDRISGNVWITRGNSGGQIYNAVSETQANMDLSPTGTLWARGTTANLQNLTFNRFRATLDKPKDNIGVNLVLLLVEENIAIDVTFTSWSQQQVGGFAYERSSNE
ncbi:MAG: hypothetical protein AAF039_17765 [Bacteroidota bacterium]